MKRIFSVIIALSCAYLNGMAQNKISAKDTIYLIDFHDVLAHRVTSRALSYAARNPYPHYFVRLVGSLAAYGINRALKISMPYLSIDYAVFHGVTNENYKEYARNIINPFILNNETLQYVSDLRRAGSQVYLFSNIGQESYNYMNRTGALDNQFDGAYLCAEWNNFATKRSSDAFKQFFMQKIVPTYQQKNPGKLPARIVMIDDSLAKLKAAQTGLRELGYNDIEFCMIQFTNLEKTKNTLAKLT